MEFHGCGCKSMFKVMMGLGFGKWRGHLATQVITITFSRPIHQRSIQASALNYATFIQSRGRDQTIMLTRSSIRNSLHTPVDHINEVLKTGEIRDRVSLCLKMEADSRSLDFPPPPLQRIFSPLAVHPYYRTTTGRRIHLSCCIELGEGLHLSRIGLCNQSTVTLDFLFTLLLSNFVSPPPSSPSSLPTTMPHLRHRMRCRRCSSRGRSQCTPSTSNSDSSSPSSDYFIGRYPNTRSG